MAERVFNVVGRPELIDDPRFATNAARVKHRGEVDAVVGDWVGEHDLDEALRIFEEAAVTAGPVYDIAQFIDDPHVRERQIIVDLPDQDLGTIPMHNIVPRLSGTPGTFRLPAPILGEHNEAILSEVGYSAPDVRRLEQQGIV
jgi:crotonobetainyl-CoA:carnitine CoA-transferase CaiB-like acyl-CoA transferase